MHDADTQGTHTGNVSDPAAIAGAAMATSPHAVVQHAQVERVLGKRLLLRLTTAKVWAVLALPVPYRPCVGDTVLALAQAGRVYVIGVLEGSGSLQLEVNGDLTLKAGGAVHVEAAEGIELRAPAVGIRARAFRAVADTVRERFGAVVRLIKGEARLKAGALKQDVAGDHRVRAGRLVQKAKGEVRIDGDQIHLG